MAATTDADHDAVPIRYRFARLGTELLAPWVLVLALPLLLAWDVTGHRPWQALLWGSVVGVTGSLIPMAVIVRGARAGRWQTHHVTDRAGRLVPFATGLASLAAGFLLLLFGGAPYQMVALSIAMLASLLGSIAITFGLRFKVSMHAAVASGAAVILAIGHWLALVPLALPVAWVCWSRVEVGDHTAREILGGVVLGAVLGGGGYWALTTVLG